MSPVEQALLAEKCTPENRNAVFAANAFVGSMMGALRRAVERPAAAFAGTIGAGNRSLLTSRSLR